MTGSQTGGKSALAAAVAGMGSVLTVVADLAGIAQLPTAPVMVIVAVLALAAFVLGLQAIALRKSGGSIWLASSAIICAMIAIVVLTIFVATGGQPPATQNQTTPPGPTSSLSQQTSSSEQSAIQAIADGEIQLQLENGSDVDQAELKVVRAQAATGNVDVMLRYYGNLQATGQGFYRVLQSDNPEAACRKAIVNGQTPEKEAASIAGRQYCLRTSSGNVAWLEIVESSIIAVDPGERAVTLAIKVWPK